MENVNNMVEPSKSLQAVFDKAVQDARQLRHEYVTLEHLLYAMLCHENFSKVIDDYGADSELLKKNIEMIKIECMEFYTIFMETVLQIYSFL